MCTDIEKRGVILLNKAGAAHYAAYSAVKELRKYTNDNSYGASLASADAIAAIITKIESTSSDASVYATIYTAFVNAESAINIAKNTPEVAGETHSLKKVFETAATKLFKAAQDAETKYYGEE